MKLALAFILNLCFLHIAFAESPEGVIEDVLGQGATEGYLREDSLAVIAGDRSEERDRIIFSSSFLVDPEPEHKLGRSLWCRTRLSVRSISGFKADVLGVRRRDDPRVFDEVHVTASGMHRPSGVQFTAGTYQIDWGLGLVLSSAYGAARAYSYSGMIRPVVGRGVVSRGTSREESWLFGASASRQLGKVRTGLFASDRMWNGNSANGNLTGILHPASASGIARRDQFEERLMGGYLEAQTGALQTGVLATRSRFTPELARAEDGNNQVSAYGMWDYGSTRLAGEFARSGNKTAWQTVLSGHAGNLSGAFFLLYSAPGLFAPRGQSFDSYGEPPENDRVAGVRIALNKGRHNFSSEMRSSKSPSATATVSPSRQETDLSLLWSCQMDRSSDLSLKLDQIVREERRSDSIVDRSFTRVRAVFMWRTGMDWALRADARRGQDIGGAAPSMGSYSHLQAALPVGNWKGGARVAYFSLPAASGALLVYDRTIAGGYPLYSISGEGRRLSGWISYRRGGFGLLVTADHLATIEKQDDMSVGVSLSVTGRQ
ncbi:MAG: hypothetical protein H6506_00575 [Calditrichaeota bacterium]|nr:hypothetical protein [Calditrichota bacterium]MCB9391131.1 hypothetical protein [Calditrichota bacterium]